MPDPQGGDILYPQPVVIYEPQLLIEDGWVEELGQSCYFSFDFALADTTVHIMQKYLC